MKSISTFIGASLLFSSVLGEANVEIPKCPQMYCTEQYQPVCGSNGVTYGNKCFFDIAACENPKLTLVGEGECVKTTKPVLTLPKCGGQYCPAVYDPVCGSDGRTYSNSCVFGIAKCRNPSLTIAYKGACGSNI